MQMRLQVLSLGLLWLTVAAEPFPQDKATDKTTTDQTKPAKVKSVKTGKSEDKATPNPAPANQTPPNTPTPGAPAPADSSPTDYYCGTIAAYSADHSKLQLEKLQFEKLTGDQAQCNKPEQSEKPTTLAIQVQNQALKDNLKNWKAGDKVIAGVTGPKDAAVLQDLRPQTSDVGVWERSLAGLASVFILLAFTWILSRNVRGLLFIGEDNRYSNSKTQVSLWFGLVIVSYVSTFVLRWCHTGFIGGIGIPTNLLLLSGLSGLTFAAAKGITSSKVSAAAATNAATDVATNAATTAAAHATAASATAAAATQAVTVAAATRGIPDAATLTAAAAATTAATVANREAATAAAAPLANAPKVQQKVAAPAASFPGDLIKDDKGKFDFGNYQMMVITLLAIASYGVVIYNFLGTLEMRASTTLPDVDTTILALFGVGHGAYLTKKAVTDASQ